MVLGNIILNCAAVSSLYSSDVGRMDFLDLVNKKKLAQDMEELVRDEDVNGFAYNINISKSKRNEVGQNAKVTIFYESISDSAVNALLNKYNSGEVTDSSAIMSKLVKLVKDKTITFSRRSDSLIVKERKNSIAIRYSTNWNIKYKNGRIINPKAIHKRIIPKREYKQI